VSCAALELLSCSSRGRRLGWVAGSMAAHSTKAVCMGAVWFEGMGKREAAAKGCCLCVGISANAAAIAWMASPADGGLWASMLVCCDGGLDQPLVCWYAAGRFNRWHCSSLCDHGQLQQSVQAYKAAAALCAGTWHGRGRVSKTQAMKTLHV
jgi:hypothetical protein